MLNSYKFSEEKILNAIIELENENRLQITRQQKVNSQNAGKNFFSQKTAWYWLTISLSIVVLTIVFIVPGRFYPIGYLRIVLGGIFVLFMPGFALTRALFPAKFAKKNSGQNMDILDYIALSLGLSIAIVAAAGLLINFLPGGLSLISITISLFAFTIVFATVAALREYKAVSQVVKISA
jgi:uncharacterized membrane protein